MVNSDGHEYARTDTIELRPGTWAADGFFLPPERIQPTCEENRAAALECIQRVLCVGRLGREASEQTDVKRQSLIGNGVDSAMPMPSLYCIPGTLIKSCALAVIIFGVWLVLTGYADFKASFDNIEAVKKRHEAWLMSLPNVVGVGIGKCDAESCIKLYVEQKTPELERRIPEQLEGFKIDIEESGPFHIQPR
jgi:hypothetical protein